MYSKEEASKTRQEFWTTFGQYMSPVLSAEGMKINWVNYKTGIKHIVFKMTAGGKDNTIGIVLTHPDEGIRELYYEQLLQLKNMLELSTGEQWAWEPFARDENDKAVCRVYATLKNKNINIREDWPALISFFKQKMIELDEFWSNARYGFEELL